MNAEEGNVYPAPLSLTHSHSFKLMFGTQGGKREGTKRGRGSRVNDNEQEKSFREKKVSKICAYGLNRQKCGYEQKSF